MKNTLLFFATAITLLFGCQVTLNAQKTNTWKGGTPGRVSDWYCATNWSNGVVPNEFSNVVIPDVSASTHAAPELWKGEVEINTLLLLSGACLTIGQAASLTVLESAEGISVETLRLKGEINLPGEAVSEKKMNDPFFVRGW